jgi:hypothetical protein
VAGHGGRSPGVVTFPDGRSVRARGLRRDPVPDPPPTFGVYLLGRPPTAVAWEHRWVRCPDFRTPASDADAIDALREAYDRCGDEVVEVACGGGIGRTGCGLAVMARFAGIAPDDAVAWVRAHHHPKAVETPWQRRWVRQVALGSTAST